MAFLGLDKLLVVAIRPSALCFKGYMKDRLNKRHSLRTTTQYSPEFGSRVIVLVQYPVSDQRVVPMQLFVRRRPTVNELLL